MTKKNYLRTPKGDRLTTAFYKDCRKLSASEGTEVATLMVASKGDGAVAVVLMGCCCQECRLQIATSALKSCGFQAEAQRLFDDPTAGRVH